MCDLILGDEDVMWWGWMIQVGSVGGVWCVAPLSVCWCWWLSVDFCTQGRLRISVSNVEAAVTRGH